MSDPIKPTRVTTVMPHRLSDGAIVERGDRRTSGTGENRLPQTRPPTQPTVNQSDVGAFRRELQRRLELRNRQQQQPAPAVQNAGMTFVQQKPKPKTPNYGEPEEGTGLGRVPPGGIKMR